MALFSHPEILEEIRKGVKLRPTSTVDKSGPFFKAEGENIPKLVLHRYDETFTGSASEQKAASLFSSNDHTHADDCSTPARAPPLPPPTFGSRNRPVKLGGKDGCIDREKLLSSIKCGVQLRKTTTNDRSGLILDDDQKSIRKSPNSLNSPNSLGSQGMSLMQTPSPTCSSGPSSASSDSLSNNTSLSSQLTSMSTPSSCGQISMTRMGSLWIRCSPTPNSSENASPLGLQGPLEQNQYNSPNSSPVPNTNNTHNQLLVPVSSAKNMAANLLAPSIGHQKVSVSETTTTDGTTKKKSDFYFDEDEQVKQRQAEVAQLVGRGSASQRIAKFSQIQQKAVENCIDNSSSRQRGSSYSTLPRNFHTNKPNTRGTGSTNKAPFCNDSDRTEHNRAASVCSGNGPTKFAATTSNKQARSSAENRVTATPLQPKPSNTQQTFGNQTLLTPGNVSNGSSSMADWWQNNVFNHSSSSTSLPGTFASASNNLMDSQKNRSSSLAPSNHNEFTDTNFFPNKHDAPNKQRLASNEPRLNQNHSVFVRAFPARISSGINPTFEKIRQSFSDNQTNSSPIGSSSATNPEHQKSSGNTNWSLNGAKWTRSIPERAVTSSNQARCWNRSLAIPTTLKNVNPAENGAAKKTTEILHSPTGESIAQLHKQFKFSINVNDSAVNDDFIRIIRC